MDTSLHKAQWTVPPCPQHEDECIDMFCKTCGKRICVTCAKGQHKDHDWIRADREARDVIRNASIRSEAIRRLIKGRKKSSMKSAVHDDIHRVRIMQKAMKDFIDKQSDKFVKKLEDGASDSDISQEITTMEKMAEFFQEGIKYAHENVIVEMEEEYIEMMNKSKSTKSMGRRMRYIEGKILPDTLEFMLGEVREDTDSSMRERSKVSVTEISSFTHGTELIRSVYLISEVEAWIHFNNSTKNERVNKDGQKSSERVIGEQFADFTVIDNDHVYTLFGSKMIRRVSSSGVITDITSTAPLSPDGICAARAGGLLVCLFSDDASNINQDSYGEIHHLDINGEILRKYAGQTNDQAKLLTRPCGIAQNINLDLCVADTIATDFTSRLVVFAVNGKKRFEYRGQKSLKHRFVCQGVACNSQGRILLADCSNNAVHLLTTGGDFIQLLLTQQSGLRDPNTLSVKGETLWVGCNKGIIKVFKCDV